MDNENIFSVSPESGDATYIESRGLYVTFYQEMTEKHYSRAGDGGDGLGVKVVHEACDRIRIMFPGNPRDTVDRTVTEDDKKNFADAWRRYQDGENYAASDQVGTPIKTWDGVGAEFRRSLIGHRVFTVEALANLSDDAIGRMGPGIRDLKKKAVEYLQHVKDSKIDEIDSLKSQLEAKKSREEDMAQSLELQAKEIVDLKRAIAKLGDTNEEEKEVAKPVRRAVTKKQR